MGTEYKYVFSIAMCLACLCFCRGDGSPDHEQILCLNSSIGWPLVVKMDGRREYDPKMQGRRCYRFVGIESFARETSLAHCPEMPKEEIVDAVFAAWWYVRYKIVPHVGSMNKEENSNLPHSFHRPVNRCFFVNHECSMNMVIHVFPFEVKNPMSVYAERVCLVTFRGTRGFLFGVYVDLNTGETGLNFWNVVDKSKLLFEFVAEYPFLNKEEFKMQEKIIGQINRASNSISRVSKWNPRVPNKKDVEPDIKVEVDL